MKILLDFHAKLCAVLFWRIFSCKPFVKLTFTCSCLYFAAFLRMGLELIESDLWKGLINQAARSAVIATDFGRGWKPKTDGRCWPAAVPKADTNLRYRVKPIPATVVDEYLSCGRRVSRKGVTVYYQPKPTLEVGFLIKRRAGNAVQRNQTRRFFWGELINHELNFEFNRGYLFLFHHAFANSKPLFEALSGIIAQANQSR